MAKYVIRPGETDFDVQDRIQGALDLPLTERGQNEVSELIETLRDRKLDTIYASPTEPALSTARRIAQELDLPLKVLESLANVNLGLWQGLSRSEIRTKQPRLFRLWEEAPESVCAPQGETCDEVVRRVQRALRKLICRRGSFAVVASEPVATLAISVLQGKSPRLCGPAKMVTQRSRVDCLETAETAS